MSKERHARECSSLVTAVLARNRGKGSDKLADKTASGPKTTALVKEGRDLGGDAAVPGDESQLETGLIDCMDVGMGRMNELYLPGGRA